MKSLAVTLAEENFSHVFSTLLETACIVCGGWVSVWPEKVEAFYSEHWVGYYAGAEFIWGRALGLDY